MSTTKLNQETESTNPLQTESKHSHSNTSSKLAQVNSGRFHPQTNLALNTVEPIEQKLPLIPQTAKSARNPAGFEEFSNNEKSSTMNLESSQDNTQSL